MRDPLCVEEKCKKSIAYKYEFIEETREDIRNLKEDIKNGIQRHPRDNHGIIEAGYNRNFRHYEDIIRAKYSIGENTSAIAEDFEHAISELEHIDEERKIDYLSLLWMTALGILLETAKENMKRLGQIIEKQQMHDFVIDYMLCASDIGWTRISNQFIEENPYAKTKEMIELAQTDKEAASKRLYTYMEKEWLQGHYDYEWKNAHKEPGYYGFWSFETAALAKILDLDDTGLQDNNRYPYDLAHYKDTMTFKPFSLSEYLEASAHHSGETEDWPEGIVENPTLEKITPIRWHAFVNDLIADYQSLDDEGFYEKYKEPMELDQIWFFIEDYKEENKDRNLLGSLIVFALTDREYILQLDFKDDVEDYLSHIKNFWDGTETKLIQFILENDQNYYALVPANASVDAMYEVQVKDVNNN